MKKSIALIVLVMSAFACSHDKSTISESKQSFVTYPFSDPDPTPRPNASSYPYFRFDGFTTDSDSMDWKVVTLENEYIKVFVLPEIGGKIWGAIEKSTGNEFIYYNSVVKFRDVATRGAWTSGGIELNFGIQAHTPAGSNPVDYKMINNKDGSVSCFIGTIDLITRTRWETEINLPADKAYFTTKSAYYNSSKNLQPYYQYSNAAYQSAGKLEFIFPGDHWVGHSGELDKWPVDSEGRDQSMYDKNNFGVDKSYHIVGGVGDFYAAYWHDLNFGSGHYSVYGDKLGKKIWIWSLARSGGIWEDLLTDTDGQYVELQSGRLFNQAASASSKTPFKHIGFAPYATDVFEEFWYPILDIGGLVKANPIGALNVTKQGDEQTISLSPLQSLKDTVSIYFGNKLHQRFDIDIKTLEIWKVTIANNPQEKPLKIIIGNKKLEYSEEKEYLTSRPLQAPDAFDWNSVYGLYVDGTEAIYQNNFARAFQSLTNCLAIDPLYTPALNQITEIYFRRADYNNALTHAKRALSINTYDPQANYLFGITNRQLNKLNDALDGLSIAAMSPEYRKAAYIELAKLYLFKEDLLRTEQFTQRVLDHDNLNQEAILLKAVVSRKNGDYDNAEKFISQLEDLSPLNHFARFEKLLLNDNKQSLEKFQSLITPELPNETYMEMALWYEYIGDNNEAVKLLEISPGNPLTYIKLAHLNHLDGNTSKSDENFNKAFTLSLDFVFPSRFEDLPALEWAAKKSDRWETKYLLGLLNWKIGQVDKARELFTLCGQTPDYAYFYLAKTNLFRDVADYDPEMDLLKALEIENGEWRTHLALIQLYNRKGMPEKALSMASKSKELLPENTIIQYNYAKSLLANGRYTESLNELANSLILPSEGSTEGRITYRKAAILEADIYFNEKNYDQALKSIEKARLWPENLGVGRPYLVDERIEDFMEAKCFLQLGQKEKALSCYNNIVEFTENNPGRNSSSDYLYLEALSQLGKNAQKDEFIRKWQQSQNNPLLTWVKAILNKRYAEAQRIEKEIDEKQIQIDPEFDLIKAIAN